MFNMLNYNGRGTENQTLIYWLKANYFIIKLYPHNLSYLVTVHLDSPLKNLYQMYQDHQPTDSH